MLGLVFVFFLLVFCAMFVVLVVSESRDSACLLMLSAKQGSHFMVHVPFFTPLVWHGRDLNPQPPAPEADALPFALLGPSISMVYLGTHFRFRPSFLNFCIRPSVSMNSCTLPLSPFDPSVSWRYINLNLNSFTITVLLKSWVGREEWVSTPPPVPA